MQLGSSQANCQGWPYKWALGYVNVIFAQWLNGANTEMG